MEKRPKRKSKTLIAIVDEQGNSYSYNPDVGNPKYFLGKGQFGLVFKGHQLSPKEDGDWVLTGKVAIKCIDLGKF